VPALCAMLPGDDEGGGIDCDLSYRSLICVLVTAKGDASTKDTWTYFPESSVQFGRTHVPPNWSPQMAPPAMTSQCVEFFCTEGDEVWTSSDAELIDQTLTGLERVGQLLRSRVDDCWVVRAADAYPVYRLGYQDELDRARALLDAFPRLTLLGRTGSFRYDNMDRVLADGRALAEQLTAQRSRSGQ